ncbi:segregation/condensation protein A [Bacillaceae bacterium]
MAYRVKLENFEGPLDLLLYLIDKHELDIYDIPVALITEQYLQYIYVMQRLELDVASEFLVMAATLLEIKSKMLLPKKEETAFQPSLDLHEEEEEEDPRAELVQRLLEYRRFKFAAQQLREKEVARSKVYTRPPEDLSPYLPAQEENPVKDVTIYDLMDALRNVLTRIKEDEPAAKVHRDEISVKDRMQEMVELLRGAGGRLRFSQLFIGKKTRLEVVTTFLALLELMKNKQVECFQERLFGEIVISLRPEK